MKCASKLWNKFSPAEQKMWSILAEKFNLEVNFPPMLTGKCLAPEREIIAHNMACQAVWAMRSIITHDSTNI